MIASLNFGVMNTIMTFWIIAGALTLLVIVITLLPVFGAAKAPDSALEYDKEIYKARLAEIEQEFVAGKISKKEHKYTLAEEGRRFLALASTVTSPLGGETKISSKPAIIGAAFAFIAICGVGFAGYSQWGSLNNRDQPLQARLDADPRGQSVQELLQRAERQLSKKPNDARGWLVVAPVYMRLNRPADAANAFRNAIRINGASDDLQTALGEALSVVAGGVVTDEAHKLFSAAVATNPTNSKAKFFLAIALNQSRDFEKSVSAWESLIAKSPPNSPWLNVAQQQLAFAQTNLNDNAPGNPTADDIKEAGKLSTGDRKEFINSMVARLEEELRDDPNNKPGWQRIIRSYSVLGRKDDALAAIKTAKNVFKDDKAFIAELERNEQTLNN